MNFKDIKRIDPVDQVRLIHKFFNKHYRLMPNNKAISSNYNVSNFTGMIAIPNMFFTKYNYNLLCLYIKNEPRLGLAYSLGKNNYYSYLNYYDYDLQDYVSLEYKPLKLRYSKIKTDSLICKSVKIKPTDDILINGY